jgi:hypothetical protein
MPFVISDLTLRLIYLKIHHQETTLSRRLASCVSTNPAGDVFKKITVVQALTPQTLKQKPAYPTTK